MIPWSVPILGDSLSRSRSECIQPLWFPFLHAGVLRVCVVALWLLSPSSVMHGRTRSDQDRLPILYIHVCRSKPTYSTLLWTLQPSALTSPLACSCALRFLNLALPRLIYFLLQLSALFARLGDAATMGGSHGQSLFLMVSGRSHQEYTQALRSSLLFYLPTADHIVLGLHPRHQLLAKLHARP